MILSLLLGALVGLVLGLLGGGGSVLAIPLLTYGLGLEPKAAVATSLGVVGAASCAAALVHARSGNLRLSIALTFGLVGALGALIGSQVARFLPGALQLLLFAGLMLLAGVRMLRSAWSGAAGLPEDELEPSPKPAPAPAWKIGAAALATGVVTGVVGVGGGFLIVPALLFLVGLPMREAIGTSLAVIVLNAAGGALGYSAYVSVDLELALPFVAGATAAGVLGSWLGQKIAPRRLQLAFGLGVIGLALVMGAREGWTLWSA